MRQASGQDNKNEYTHKSDRAFLNRALQDRAWLDDAGGNERGVIVAFLAASVVVLLMAGALAVDLSATTVRGQQLQNVADAAALAGAAAWPSSDPDLVEEAVAAILVQNGIVGADIEHTIAYPSDTEVSVSVTDTSPSRLLSPLGVGSEPVSRSATAMHEPCAVDCNDVVSVPPPLGYIRAAGTGDGFLPIPIGNRYYAINHHASTVMCVDKATNMACWAEERRAFPVGFNSEITMTMHHPYVVGTRIYYLGIDNTNSTTADLILTCFETTTDTPCPLVANFGAQGHGTLAGTSDGLFVFTGTRRVFCISPTTHATCSDYDGGKTTFLNWELDWTLATTNTWTSDVVVNGDKIYHSIASAGEVFVQCWDITTDDDCNPFLARTVLGTADRAENEYVHMRLFLARNSVGVPTAICVLGDLQVTCRHLETGLELDDIALDLDPLRVFMFDEGFFTHTFAGVHSYHPLTNRLFAVDAFTSRTYCFDFTLNEMCGAITNDTPLGPALTYGYIAEGDCLIGLGDASIFFSLKPDMSGPCEQAPGTVEVRPCQCGDAAAWPILSIEQSGAEPFDEFRVRVLSPTGVQLLPATGQWVDLLTGPLELRGLSTALGFVTLEFSITPSSRLIDPWTAGTPPQIAITAPDRVPRLVD